MSISVKRSEQSLSLEEKTFLKKEYLRAFVDYRGSYINDISIFIRIFTLALDLIHLLEINDPEIVTRCQSFHSFVNSIKKRKLSPDKSLSGKDVEEVNMFLNYMIANLQK